MLIFVGSVYPDYLRNYLLESGLSVDFASNSYQNDLLKGFSDFFSEIKVVSSPYVRYPNKCKKEILQEEVIETPAASFSLFKYVGTNRSRVWKLFSEFFRIKKGLKSVLSDSIDKNNICCYSLHSPFLLAILCYRRRISKVCVVIPDLPEFMAGNENILRRLAKWVDRRIINFCIKRMDCFALLSKAMEEKLPINGKPWVLVEGIFQPTKIPQIDKNEKTIILYTGQLQKRYGLYDLVSAFMLIPNSDYELWLCGGSNEMEWFYNKAKEDNRIKLLGRVSHEEALTLQKKATLLVNPRHSNEVFTKYSFPSKTMEYLASGTPTLMCKLSSIPEEYFEHLYFFEDESINGMKDTLIKVCSIDKSILEEKGNKASLFILNYKTPHFQSKKIIEVMGLCSKSNNN